MKATLPAVDLLLQVTHPYQWESPKKNVLRSPVIDMIRVTIRGQRWWHWWCPLVVVVRPEGESSYQARPFSGEAIFYRQRMLDIRRAERSRDHLRRRRFFNR